MLGWWCLQLVDSLKHIVVAKISNFAHFGEIRIGFGTNFLQTFKKFCQIYSNQLKFKRVELLHQLLWQLQSFQSITNTFHKINYFIQKMTWMHLRTKEKDTIHKMSLNTLRCLLSAFSHTFCAYIFHLNLNGMEKALYFLIWLSEQVRFVTFVCQRERCDYCYSGRSWK